MLTRKDLQDLTEISNEGHAFINSVYLTVDPAIYSRDEYIAIFKNLAREEMQKHPQEGVKGLESEIDHISQYLALNKNIFKKGLALFSSRKTNFWREYHLSVILNDQVIIDRRPYIKPLAELLDNFQQYIVALVDRESARLFLVHLGEIQEYAEHSSPDVPGKHKKGGWYGFDQSRFARQIEKQVNIHLKEVIDILKDLVLSQDYMGRICIGGPVEAVTRFKDMLPPALKEKVVGTFKEEMTADPEAIKRKTLEIMKRVEREKEEEFIQDIISRAYQGNRAALGLDDVVANVVKGNVQKIGIQSGLRREGYRCKPCQVLLTSSLERCPYCQGKEMETIPYFIDLVIQQAVNQGALVEIILHQNQDFEKAGSIGALLRY